jgi:hypothetical protein
MEIKQVGGDKIYITGNRDKQNNENINILSLIRF